MNSEDTGIDKLSYRILEGIRKASRKLVEKSAADNKALIVADKDGKPISVPAKELLKKL